jgi:hypothetical protein
MWFLQPWSRCRLANGVEGRFLEFRAEGGIHHSKPKQDSRVVPGVFDKHNPLLT